MKLGSYDRPIPGIEVGALLHTCHLLELPTELRLGIYEFIFETDYECLIGLHGGRTPIAKGLMLSSNNCGPIPLRLAALLRTCRTVLDEALPILYQQTTFTFSINIYSHQGIRTNRHRSMPYSSLRHMSHIRQITVDAEGTCRAGRSHLSTAAQIANLAAALPADYEIEIPRVIVHHRRHATRRPGAEDLCQALLKLRGVQELHLYRMKERGPVVYGSGEYRQGVETLVRILLDSDSAVLADRDLTSDPVAKA
jgi:hypothetical protein